MGGGSRLKGSSKSVRTYYNVSSTVSIASSNSRRQKEGLLCKSPASVVAPAANDLSFGMMKPMMRKRRTKGRESGSGGIYYREESEVEDACRSFENYLVEMIVEEGRVRDLMDVEELLYCWKKLKCPVFVDLVSRFYGELCRDLFATNNNTPSGPEDQLIY